MPSFTETRVLPYSPRQLYDLVLAIETYPEFLPWCRAARIISRESEQAFLGELIISFAHLTERYTSQVAGRTPDDNTPGEITVTLVRGPFKHLTNDWRFTPHAEGTELFFHVDFEFKSKLLGGMIGGIFGRACEKMVGAFLERANSLYSQRR